MMNLGSEASLSSPATKRRQDRWSARRWSQAGITAKRSMAYHFVEHEFLVKDGAALEEERETVASVMVNQGTTPNLVVKLAVDWVKEHHLDKGPFDITWYSPGTLIPATLRDARIDSESGNENLELRPATRLFIFPGLVDPIREVVSGPEPIEYVNNMKRCFRYAFLGAYAFDLSKGQLYFHYSSEVQLQSLCATRYAARKYIFLEPSKFRIDGVPGYSLSELFDNSESITLYTCSSGRDEWMCDIFPGLCKELGLPSSDVTLRLFIIGGGHTPTIILSSNSL